MSSSELEDNNEIQKDHPFFNTSWISSGGVAIIYHVQGWNSGSKIQT
jgi:hypothetical protein